MAFLKSVGKAGEVAERSPAVISANLKEDMLLQKKRVVLDRSARNLVHQIKIDQKVVYKNFQSRLVRSKLAFARLMGQKDIEKELRSKNLGGLNTDIVGCADEECSFLEKLEQRPCTASSISPRINMPKSSKTRKQNGRKQRPILMKSKDVLPDMPVKEPTERPSSATGRVCDMPPAGKDPGLRPATTTGVRVDNDFIRHQINMADEKKDPVDNKGSERELILELSGKIENVANKVSNCVNGNQNANDNVPVVNEKEGQGSERNDKSNVDETYNKDISNDTKPSVVFFEELELDLTKLQRPRTVAATGQADIDDDASPPISPKQYSRQASSRASDFFQEEKKIDLIQLRLDAARAVDFTEQVRTFCESLESGKDKNKPTTDYYTLRLEASIKERLESDIAYVPGTPEDENRRAMGNIHVRSLTVPKINWNFE